MVEESVEATVVDPGELAAEKYDVQSFDAAEYVQYFSSDHYKQLTDLFSTRSYGWKQAARLLHKIKESDKRTSSLKDDLSDMCTGKPRTRDPMKDARSSLRRVIVALPEDKLQELCFNKSVSYSSFINGNDRQGLFEAIIDELLVSV